MSTLDDLLFKLKIFRDKDKIVYLLNILTKQLHPLDIYTVFEDIAKDIGGTENLLKKIKDEKQLILKNNLEIIGESDFSFANKKYPVYLRLFIFEWLALCQIRKDFYEKDVYYRDKIQSIFEIILQSRNDPFEALGERHKKYIELDEINWFKIDEEFNMMSELFINNLANDIEEDFLIFNRLIFIVNRKLLPNELNKSIENLLKSLQKFVIIKSMNPFSFVINEYPFIKSNPKLKLTHKEFNDLLNFFGKTKYDKYVQKVKSNGKKYYFNEEYKNIFLLPLEINKTPFLRDTQMERMIKTKGKCYIFPVDHIFGLFMNKLRDKIDPQSFGNLIEEYMIEFFQSLLCRYPVFPIDKYIFDKSLIYKKDFGEIDFYIYNKETKNIIVFEIKTRNELDEMMYKREHLFNITGPTQRDGKGKVGEVRKGMEQLIRAEKNKQLIAQKIGVDEIQNVFCVFVNLSKSQTRNTFMRGFLEAHFEFKETIEKIDYTFMSLQEFEEFVFLCISENMDFFDICKEKNTNTIGFPAFNFFRLNIDEKNNEYYNYEEGDMWRFLKKKFGENDHNPFDKELYIKFTKQ